MPFGEDDTPGVTDEVVTGQDGAGGNAGESNGAASSDAPGASEDEGLLAVVRDAVAEKKPEPAAASPADGVEEGDKPDANAPKEQDDENYSDVPFNKHPRFRKLLSERNAFKEDAGQYRQVQSFLRDSGISAAEAGDVLVTVALCKNDPSKGWPLLKPFVEKVLQAAGEVLPPDLQQMVRDGAMTSEAAYEVSRSRAGMQSLEHRQRFDAQRSAERQAEETAAALQGEAVTWEQERRARDPNFDAKHELILRELTWRHSQGDRPSSPLAVRQQLDAVYKAVNETMPAPAQPAAPAVPPARRPIKPVTGGSVAGGARPKPSSILEIVQAGG